MNETTIQKQLDNLFPNSNLEIQVVYEVPYLKVAINYYSTLSFDRTTLTQRIEKTLSKLDLPDEVQYLALYIRPINETEPDWSTCVRLSSTKNSQEANLDQPSATQHNDRSEPEKAVTAEKSETAQKENSSVENKQLSDYCFIRNQSLLNKEIVAPPLPVAELVTSFHELSASEKQQLLPIMSQLLQQKTPEGIEEISAQQWIEKLFTLNEENLRKARIWLSRYCYDPEKTIATLKNTENQSEESKEFQESQKSEEPQESQESVVKEETKSNSIPKTRSYNQVKSKSNKTYKPKNIKNHEKTDRYIENTYISFKYNIELAWKIFKTNLGIYLTFLLFSISIDLPFTIITNLMIQPSVESYPTELFKLFEIYWFINMTLNLLILLLISILTENNIVGSSINFESALKKALAKIPINIIVGILFIFLFGIGFFFFVIPGFYIYVIFSFFPEAIALRNCQFDAFEYSYKLVKNQFWKVFFRFLQFGFSFFILSLLVNLPLSLINNLLSSLPIIQTIFQIILGLISSIAIYFSMTAYTVYFLNLDYLKNGKPLKA